LGAGRGKGGVIEQRALYVRQRVVTQAKSNFTPGTHQAHTSSTHQALSAVTVARKTTARL
jgi:hypothetical protein